MADLPSPIQGLLRRAARARRNRWLAWGVVVSIGVTGAVGSALLGISRFVPVPWAERSVLVGGIVLALAAGAAAVFKRPSQRSTAHFADERLGGQDRLTTAVELLDRESVDGPGTRQVQQASSWAAARSDVSQLGPARPSLVVVALMLLVVGGALTLALVPAPADAELTERARVEALTEDLAGQVEKRADDPLLSEEAAEELRDLAARLREAASLDAASLDIAEARSALEEASDPKELSQRTAMSALEHTLGSDDVAAALEALGAGLPEALAAQMAAALGQRAADLAGIDPELAAALADLAEALASGEGLEAAAGAAAQAAGDLAGALSAADALNAAQNALADLQAALTEAQAQGQGQGQGEGQGQGQGQGEGQGQGQEQGQGQGGQGGGGGGTVTDVDGQGGQGGVGSGQVGVGTDFDAPKPPTFGQIVDVPNVTASDEIRVDLNGFEEGSPDGQVTGSGIRNVPTVRYQDRYADYLAQALAAIDRAAVPIDSRDLIRAYFTEIEP